MSRRNQPYAIKGVLAFLVVGTILSWVVPIDLTVARWLFDPKLMTWPIGDIPCFRLANRYGQMVGWIPALLAIAVLVLSIWSQQVLRFRKPAWFLILLLALGPGLLVNVVLKDHWGRPRPNQTEEFGGRFAYQPAWVKSPAGDRRTSFPSGHAAMGFFFVAPYFILLTRRRRLAHGLLAAGIVFGVFVGLARIAKGAHWPSDVLWSFGVVYLVAYGLARWLRLNEPPDP